MNFRTHFSLALLIACGTSTVLAQDTKKDWRLYQPVTEKSDTLSKTKNAVVPESVEPSNHPGKITYFQDSKLVILDSLRTEYPNKLSGYRVQIYFGNRGEARDIRAKFMLDHPDVGAYISYLAPNFRLRVGDFRSRLECEAFKKEIARNYPGSYLVKDKIELPDLRQESSED